MPHYQCEVITPGCGWDMQLLYSRGNTLDKIKVHSPTVNSQQTHTMFPQEVKPGSQGDRERVGLGKQTNNKLPKEIAQLYWVLRFEAVKTPYKLH